MDAQRNARIANVILGVWLFISAFIWPHNHPQYINAWLVGLLVTAISIIGFFEPSIRYLNTALAVWLFVSAFALPRMTVGTSWNHALVGIAIFIVSLAPSSPAGVSQPGRPTAVRDAHST
jgi:hypothetical protein